MAMHFASLKEAQRYYYDLPALHRSVVQKFQVEQEFFLACFRGDCCTVLHLLKRHGENLLLKKFCYKNHRVGRNYTDDPGSLLSCIHIAAFEGHPELLEVLLHQAITLLLKDVPKDGGREDFRKFVNERISSNGWTPLIVAAFHGRTRCIHVLMCEEYRRDVNLEAKTSTNGWTALMMAAYHGHARVVKYLRDRGAHTCAETSNGRTALELAKEGAAMNREFGSDNYDEIIEILSVMPVFF